MLLDGLSPSVADIEVGIVLLGGATLLMVGIAARMIIVVNYCVHTWSDSFLLLLTFLLC
jgi:hypothetical protein